MDPVAELAGEHIVDEPVLRDSGQAGECRGAHHGIEMMAVSGHARDGFGDVRLDARLDLIGRCGHLVKGSEVALYF